MLEQLMILIVTIQDDIHALSVQRHLAQLGYPDCVILESDRISADHQIHWAANNEKQDAYLEIRGSGRIAISSIDLIWWRRVRADQSLEVEIGDKHQLDLINNDCRGALNGVLAAAFTGIWVSRPDSTLRASDKLFQLSIAKQCGFRVPDTLVSQCRNEVEEFVDRHHRNVIVKPVVGAVGPLIYTQFMRDPTCLDAASFQACPAVYQEYISGTRHIRLNCFGDRSYAAVIETEELDWRPNLKVPIAQWDVPDSLHGRVRGVLDKLDLAMGVFDFKLTPDGEVVWLEVNPQGQFLFLEPLTKLPLGERFADYLLGLVQNRRDR
jgi:glutathione synthase/RimK-type ligase-like ATP-grasp enzyme